MSKSSSGLFQGTKGSFSRRIIPGQEGIIFGGNSTTLGKNMLHSMGLSRKIQWKGYQAKHIIPKELANHPILKKIGIDLDHQSNGIYLRTPSDLVSTLTRHRGYHAPYTEFVRTQLDSLDINASPYQLQREVSKLQTNLRRMQMSGVTIYPKQGATVDSISKAYKRISTQRKKDHT